MLVELPQGLEVIRYRRRRPRSAPTFFRKHKFIETMVYRIELPKTQDDENPYVWADAFVPQEHAAGIPAIGGWVGPGVYRAKAYIKSNRNSLRAFLASGDLEWDVSEV
ncbi:hypothetical protein VSR68_11260 [Paraburkholderia phymatum]|uniref:hypothetical protein n=1 Tax=Paraburkholderia phymatum TaxID=148447 RepID=UPI00316EB5A5